MERYARGDEAAFGELYDAIAPRLLGFLRKATRDAFAAEDLMQLTLLHMHRARGSFIPGAPVLPWAFAIARRLMTDHARRRRVEQRLFSEAAADDDRMAHEPTASDGDRRRCLARAASKCGYGSGSRRSPSSSGPRTGSSSRKA